MKLHWSPRSPFVRKVMIVAHELGLVDRITCIRTVAATTKPHAVLMDDNPLSKIPTLLLDDGTVLYDSRVVCEYLDGLHGGYTFFPADTKVRMVALRRQALGDGCLDFLLLLRNERERAQPSEAHLAAYTTKKHGVLKALERGSRRSRRYARSTLATSRSAPPSPIWIFATPTRTGARRTRASRAGTKTSARGLRCAPRSRSMTASSSFLRTCSALSGHSRDKRESSPSCILDPAPRSRRDDWKSGGRGADHARAVVTHPRPRFEPYPGGPVGGTNPRRPRRRRGEG